jgi:hypothetical protein
LFVSAAQGDLRQRHGAHFDDRPAGDLDLLDGCEDGGILAQGQLHSLVERHLARQLP